jgi:hypothetical protein
VVLFHGLWGVIFTTDTRLGWPEAIISLVTVTDCVQQTPEERMRTRGSVLHLMVTPQESDCLMS